ncbi:PQQ-dependent sugar dehydrogenase [Natrinema sp. DC36]|uniref:PQQ-dependent sugar dehydrogenase n=1 Tax=Natrinema sp. DC36 TaxID=2878680 RepID=UPI001CF08EBA|nr:PQQ-dependent sugar dehydrogenase [Natrinema sp. DC36]
MTRNDDSKTATSRRTILRSTAALSVAGLALPATAQEDTITGEIELGGRISAWVGLAPDAIADERNPTLQLEQGETYTLTWENLDGAPHNFNIESEGGDEQFVSTEIVSQSGETQTVEFEAQEGMAQYYCGPHPVSMRGDIEFVDETAAGGAEQPGQYIGEGPTVGLETVAEGELTAPTSLTVPDEDADRRFVTDQTGQIYVHGPDGLQDEPFLDISDRIVELMEFDERGLLGLAFHPDFEENGRFFVRYSAPLQEDMPEDYDHTFVLSEFRTASDDNETADPESERRILEIPEPQFNHNSGSIAFGPDGYLYVGSGDGGGANDTGLGHVDDWYDDNDGGNGQDTEENLLGGILRLDIDVESDEQPYGIPDDNPLVDQEGHRGEHYAWGFRNPWGMSFTDDGELLAADVGQNLIESVNHVRAGGNYSWNVKEGTYCFSTETPTTPPDECPNTTPDDVRGGEPLLDPVLEYPHELGIIQSPNDAAGNGTNGGDGAGNTTENGGNTTTEMTEDDSNAGGNMTEGGGDGGNETAVNGTRANGGVVGDQIGVSITGGYLYEGGEIDALEGAYIFGDWSLDGESPGTVFLARPPESWPEDADGGGPEDLFLDPPTDGDDEGDGNETDGDGGDSDGAQGTTQRGLWPIAQIQLQGEAAENGRPSGFVYAFGEGADGEIYVLTTTTSTVEGDGAVHRLVPAEDGDGGEMAAEADAETGNETAAGNETTDDGAAAADNKTAAVDNETVSDGAADGNETAGE